VVIVVILLLIGICNPSHAQVNQKSKYEKEFLEFQKSAADNFTSFLDKNDSTFLQFLETTWKDFNTFKEQSRKRIKPLEQPVFNSGQVKSDVSPNKRMLQEHPGNKTFENIKPDNPGDELERKPTNGREIIGNQNGFNYYGQWIDLQAANDLPGVSSIYASAIINYYKAYCANRSLVQAGSEIGKAADDLILNDWGYLYLLINASAQLYPLMNDRVLFVWMTLMKNEFDVRVGHDLKNIYLLVNFDGRVFNKQYANISERKYYIYAFPGQSEPTGIIRSYDAIYSNKARPVSISLEHIPLLGDKTIIRKIQVDNDVHPVALNLSLINYMNDYPDCELEVYFRTPMSDKVINSLDKILLPGLSGKSEQEKAAMLLSFVQNSIPYKIDEQQFGFENYLFADETLYYPFADCEDRAILLAKLVERYTGLGTIGLDYTDHVSLGIKLINMSEGDYVLFMEERYYICDPTYLGAEMGVAMDFMKTETPKIITRNH